MSGGLIGSSSIDGGCVEAVLNLSTCPPVNVNVPLPRLPVSLSGLLYLNDWYI